MTTRSEKLVFPGAQGHELAGRLERPAGEPSAWALFAHCFTCSKDIPAATRIARTLAARGVAVLRFDFTGLGGSEGDFANTSFSSNTDDLVAAADWLRAHHKAPALLVGHSLGGAAVLAVARRIAEVEAVATIGAPADPAHVRHLLTGSLDEILRAGEARVAIAGRAFTIKQQFLDDLDEQHLGGALGALDAALLIMHSPTDEVVGIDNARRIYEAARGFKSFVSLAHADHMLSRRDDAEYAAEVLAAWASRYVDARPAPPRAQAPQPGVVRVEELRRPYTVRIAAGRHEFLADEPEDAGGRDEGPNPYEYLLAALGACTALTLRMYAERKAWPLEHVAVSLRHSKIHATECARCDEDAGRADRFERVLELRGALDGEQRARLLEIADRCPVHRSLEGAKEILTRLA
jgi:putative redox protein